MRAIAPGSARNRVALNANTSAVSADAADAPPPMGESTVAAEASDMRVGPETLSVAAGGATSTMCERRRSRHASHEARSVGMGANDAEAATPTAVALSAESARRTTGVHCSAGGDSCASSVAIAGMVMGASESDAEVALLLWFEAPPLDDDDRGRGESSSSVMGHEVGSENTADAAAAAAAADTAAACMARTRTRRNNSIQGAGAEVQCIAARRGRPRVSGLHDDMSAECRNVCLLLPVPVPAGNCSEVQYGSASGRCAETTSSGR